MKELASIVGGLIVAALLAIVILYVFSRPASDITLEDITPGVASSVNTAGTAPQGTAPAKGPESEENKKEQADFYIIVGSIRNLIQAKQKAKEFIDDYNKNFIVLSPTTEGYYRISSGKYSTLEEAKTAIKDVRANINPQAWILSVKREY